MGLGSRDDLRASGSAPGEQVSVVLDVAGRRVDLSPAEVLRLRDAAAAEAGSSSIARDLSLLLSRARSSAQTLALRPGERRALTRIAAKAGLGELASRLKIDPSKEDPGRRWIAS